MKWNGGKVIYSRKTQKSTMLKPPSSPEVNGQSSTNPINTMIAQNADKRFVHLRFTSGKRCCFARTGMSDEGLYTLLNDAAPVIGYFEFSNHENYKSNYCVYNQVESENEMAYESPVPSRIPGGYNCRQVTMDSFSDPKFVEALKRNTTTFYIPEDEVFACTLEDKRKLLTWLRSNSRYTEMIIFWPGKYQSHAFRVRRHAGLMTKILELLGPDANEKRLENLRKLRKIKAELAALETELAETPVYEAPIRQTERANAYARAKNTYPYDDWNDKV